MSDFIIGGNKMKNKCSCGSDLFYVSKVGCHHGLYCSVCGAWYKWADKNEVRLYSRVNNGVESVNNGVESVEIKVKYLRDVPKLKKINTGDWIDLYVGEDIEIPINTYTLIPLGVAMELPLGYEAIIAPRSSTFKRYGLIQTNSIGIIDESYNGDTDEWLLPVISCTQHVVLKKGTRICQFRIIKHQPTCKFVEVQTLDNNPRGGFGGTGI